MASPLRLTIGNDPRAGFSDNARMVNKVQPANHLRAWRELRRMTQAQLGEKAGTTGNVISQLESGARGLSDKWLRILAPLLGTSPGFLLDHDPNTLDSRFLEAAMNVDPDQRERVTVILEQFARKR